MYSPSLNIYSPEDKPTADRLSEVFVRQFGDSDNLAYSLLRFVGMIMHIAREGAEAYSFFDRKAERGRGLTKKDL